MLRRRVSLNIIVTSCKLIHTKVYDVKFVCVFNLLGDASIFSSSREFNNQTERSNLTKLLEIPEVWIQQYTVLTYLSAKLKSE